MDDIESRVLAMKDDSLESLIATLWVAGELLEAAHNANNADEATRWWNEIFAARSILLERYGKTDA